jgi:hypothetical protein
MSKHSMPIFLYLHKRHLQVDWRLLSLLRRLRFECCRCRHCASIKSYVGPLEDIEISEITRYVQRFWLRRLEKAQNRRHCDSHG